MNKATNKFHCDLRHPTKREMEMSKSNKFDTLPPFVQVAVLASLVLTVPLWGVPYFIHLLLSDLAKSRKKDEHLTKIARDAMALQANQEYLRQHFRRVRADVARREQPDGRDAVNSAFVLMGGWRHDPTADWDEAVAHQNEGKERLEEPENLTEDEYEDSCVEEPDPLDDYDNDAADAMKEQEWLDEQDAEESQ